MEQLTPNVFVDTQFVIPFDGPGPYGCNPSFIVTTEGIVMIDTPAMPTYAIKWRGEIAKKGEVKYILNTEYHPDHISGNYFFPGTVVSHDGVKKLFTAPVTEVGVDDDNPLKKDKQTFATKESYYRQRVTMHDPEGLVLLEGYQFREPTITFSERLTIYLGNHTFELIHLPGHTPYEVGVYVPEERIVFTGDNFTNGWETGLVDSCPLEWLESLKKIEAMDVDYIVPGHGPVGDKAALREFTAFIQGVIDTVKKAIEKGLSKEEAANTVKIKGLPNVCHPGVEQQKMNIRRLYEMLSK